MKNMNHNCRNQKWVFLFFPIVFSLLSFHLYGQYTPPANGGTGSVTLSGELKKWHKITLSFNGPYYNESDSAPNPFYDLRLNVTFTNGSKTYVVPGYFAADGNAGETSAASGNIWRVHFCPDAEGVWNYTVSFRIGQNIAASSNPDEGTAVSPLNSKTGSFTISATDKAGADHRGKGMLQYVGEHFLKFAETGEFFIKGGPNSPESFLAYYEMDATPSVYSTNTFSGHVQHWQTGNPVWKGTKGKGIIGAINYMSAEKMNVFYCLTLSSFGDCKNVWPWTSAGNPWHYDCSKLDQWEIVFSHMDKMGMLIHMVFTETENEAFFELVEKTSPFATARKIYYRELIARFSHHLAMVWNLGEENGWNDGSTSIYKAGNTDAQRKSFSTFIRNLDPYNHPINVHTLPGQWSTNYTPLLGYPDFEGISGQLEYKGYSMDDAHPRTIEWIGKSNTAGKKWFVCIDEPGHDNVPDVSGDDAGVRPDALDANHDIPRKDVLWGNLMAGGQGVEWYIGWNYISGGGGDGRVDDYSKFNNMWDQTRYALEFFHAYLPYWQMTSKDNLVTNSNWCLAKEGEVYVVYIRNGGTCNLTINTNANYIVKWYDPRNGGALQNGSVLTLSGTGAKSLGTAPNNTSKDWVVLIKKDNGGNQSPVAKISVSSTTGTAPFSVDFDASASSDADGTIVSWSWLFKDGSAAGTGSKISHTFNNAGSYNVELTVTDDKGATGTASVVVTVNGTVNKPPVAQATASALTGKFPVNITFDGSSSSDPDGTIVSYAWDFKDGSAIVYGMKTSHTFTKAGVFNVILTITDNKGAPSSTSLAITVGSNILPVPKIVVSSSSGTAPMNIFFDASSSTDADGTVVSWTWDFKDGSLDKNGVNVSHTFEKPGVYAVLLTIIDNNGGTSTKTIAINISSPASLNDDSQDLKVYPLPAHDQLWIEHSKRIVYASFSDLTGKRIFVCSPTNSINLDNLPNGIFIVTFHLEDGSVVLRKIIKE